MMMDEILINRRRKCLNMHNKHFQSPSNRYFSSLSMTNYEHESKKEEEKKKLLRHMYTIIITCPYSRFILK